MKTSRSNLLRKLPSAARGGANRLRARFHQRRVRAHVALKAQGPLLRRCIDLLVTGIALLLAAPIILIAGLAMKLSSPGPIFFGQERIGRFGRPFTMYKLRTMVHGADSQKAALEQASADALSGVRFKLRRDPRVTAVGRVLRKFSIDELPQLWNVFCGDMTLIGPRPAVWREVRLYDPRALRRLEVTPGLTCLWQVRGRSDLSFEQQVALDLEYIDKVGVKEELGIVVNTIPAVLMGRGSY